MHVANIVTSPPIRVGLFTDADVFAGTERHIFDLARGLRQQGADVSVMCPEPSPLAERASAEGIDVIAIAKRGQIDVRAIRAIRKLLKQGRLDVVHAHNGRTAVAASIAASLAGRGRCVATQHFIQPNRTRQQGINAILSRTIHGYTSRRTHHYVAISQAAFWGMLERGDAPREKITVIPNGIVAPDESQLASPASIREKLQLNESDNLIVCVARLEKEKDIATLIDAMALVIKDRPQARCVVAGEGTDHALLQERIEASGLSSAVRLLGFQPDSLSLIRAADIFVLPSVAEPFGLVLLEAMSLGRPVIATAAGGPLEIVENGRTGLLVPPSQPPAMAAAILRLLADPALRDHLGHAGLDKFHEKFNVERMSMAAMQVYRQCLAN